MFNNATYNDWLRGSAFACAMGIPLGLNYLIDAPDILAFMALGGMFGLRLDPHRRPSNQAFAIIGGMALIIISGTLGTFLVGHKELSIAALVLMAYLAGQPKSNQAYLSLLTKLIAAALLIAEMGLPANLSVAIAYLSGAILAFILSVVEDLLEPNCALYWEPFDELKQLMSGDINGPLFGFTLPLTILAASISAQWINARHAGWVGLTVLFVMHVNDASTWIRLRQRIIGTLLGVLIAYALVRWLPIILFPLLITLLALFIPLFLRQSYQWFSTLITVIILLVINIALLHHGGDLELIRWRFFDTLLGCFWVATALILLRLGKHYWPKKSLK